jgi:hypothetical protein
LNQILANFVGNRDQTAEPTRPELEPLDDSPSRYFGPRQRRDGGTKTCRSVAATTSVRPSTLRRGDDLVNRHDIVLPTVRPGDMHDVVPATVPAERPSRPGRETRSLEGERET